MYSSRVVASKTTEAENVRQRCEWSFQCAEFDRRAAELPKCARW